MAPARSVDPIRPVVRHLGTVAAMAQPVPAPRRPSIGLASLILGITGLVLFFFLVPAAVALVLGVVAVREIRSTPGQPGLRMAVAGLVLGAIGVTLFLAAAVATVVGAAS